MKSIMIGLTFVVIAGVTAAADSVPPNVHVKAAAADPSPVERLQGACDVAIILADDLETDKVSEKAQSDLQVLHDLVCLK
jgi:hypothetical protein